MSAEGTSHLRPDEAIKRQNAELLQAEVADLVLFLVGTVLSNISLASVVHDTIMAWATEAVEHAGQRKERRPTDEAAPVYELKRLVDLAFQVTYLRSDLDDAMLSIEDAARQLATISPKSPDWYRARLVLDQAINQLADASTRLVQFDADTQTPRTHEPRQEPTEIPVIDVPTPGEPSHPFPSALDLVTGPGRLPTSARVELDEQTIEAGRQLEELIETLKPQTDPAPIQRGIAPGPSI